MEDAKVLTCGPNKIRTIIYQQLAAFVHSTSAVGIEKSQLKQKGKMGWGKNNEAEKKKENDSK